MRILVSGSTGLIGRHLVIFLENLGHQVVRLVRSQRLPTQDEIVWNPASGIVDPQAFVGIEAVIHLAGENIAARRWTKEVKNELFRSRCRDTWLLCQALGRLKIPPKVVITASAIGYYGDRGEESLDESMGVGKGFLADLCDHWERATEVIEQNGTRVAHSRFGAVMTMEGGMLRKLATSFRLGLGATLGNGKQWLCWVGIEDVISALYHILTDSRLRGPVNVCTEHPLRNEDFTRLFAKALHRKAFLRIPAPVLRLLFGDLANEGFLASAKALPKRLLSTGFTFKQPYFEQLFPVSGSC